MLQEHKPAAVCCTSSLDSKHLLHASSSNQTASSWKIWTHPQIICCVVSRYLSVSDMLDRNTKTALKVKCQGQMSPRYNDFRVHHNAHCLPSYINFWSTVFQLLSKQTKWHTQTLVGKTIPALHSNAGMQVINYNNVLEMTQFTSANNFTCCLILTL